MNKAPITVITVFCIRAHAGLKEASVAIKLKISQYVNMLSYSWFLDCWCMWHKTTALCKWECSQMEVYGNVRESQIPISGITSPTSLSVSLVSLLLTKRREQENHFNPGTRREETLCGRCCVETWYHTEAQWEEKLPEGPRVWFSDAWAAILITQHLSKKQNQWCSSKSQCSFGSLFSPVSWPDPQITQTSSLHFPHQVNSYYMNWLSNNTKSAKIITFLLTFSEVPR